VTQTFLGAYCPECDDVYSESVRECPEHGIVTCEVPADFYERHPECLEVARLLYEDVDSVGGSTNGEEGVIAMVVAELRKARAKFPQFNSAHEGYAVLLEEVDELWDAIKRNDDANAREEAQQVAAMAIRFLLDVGNGDDAA
jgi:hypothetical protein